MRIVMTPAFFLRRINGWPLFLVPVLLLGLSGISLAGGPGPGLGLFRLHSNSFFQSFRMKMPFAPTCHPRAGQWEVGCAASVANDWAYEENEHIIDGETFSGSLWVARALSDTLRLEIALMEERLTGGFLDNTIEAFHGLSGVGQNHRDSFAAGRTDIHIKWNAWGDTLYMRDRGGPLVRGTRLTLSGRALAGSGFWPGVSWSAAVAADLNDPALTRRDFPVDAGLSLCAFRQVGPLVLS